MRHREVSNEFGNDNSVVVECSETSHENSTTWKYPQRRTGSFSWFFLAFFVFWSTFVSCQTFNSTKDTGFIEWDKVDYTFIFGDSYSSIDYNVSGYHPWAGNPIGNPAFPGNTFSAGSNWVGYITGTYNESLVLTNDLAVGGSVVQSVVNQIKETFLPYAGEKPYWSPWNANNTLFIIWIGNNDCLGTYNLTRNLDILFYTAAELLYNAGAQNFLFVNVAPFDRSPYGNGTVGLPERIAYWNIELPNYVYEFATTHPNVSTAIYDSHTLWSLVIDDPTKYGFQNAVCNCSCNSCIWVDGLHSTFAMHKIYAADLTNFLGNTNHSLPPANTTTNSTTSNTTGSGSPSKSMASRTLPINITIFVISVAVAVIGVGMLPGI